MVGQRPIHFGDDRVGETVVAERDHRVQRVAETAQILLLTFRELHRVSIVESEP